MIQYKFSYLMYLLYKHIIKRILFMFDPEFVHNRMLEIGNLLGRFSVTRNFIKLLFVREFDNLFIEIKGVVRFKNPIGLSAGFDKEGNIASILPSIGFGHAEIGSVTLYPYEGNSKPRLKRLKKSQSIWVNYGLKNDGTRVVVNRLLQSVQPNFVYGLSIAKTNSKDTCDENQAIQDYLESFKLAVQQNIFGYITINISCPNTFGGEPFTSVDKIKKLLDQMDQIERKCLVFVKMPISIDDGLFVNLLEEIAVHKIDGIVVGNLQKNKNGDHIKEKLDEFMISKGGLSGRPTFERSNELIKLSYRNFGQRLIIVGCGGVFTAADAYKKIRLGATLVQMVTGLIYNGPSSISLINKELSELIKEDGFKSISEVIGIDARI